VLKVNKNNKNAWILEGESLLKLYRNSEALDVANQAIKRWPTSSDSLLLKARVNAKLPGQVKTSIDGYNQVINQFKNPDPSLLIERADTQLSIGTKGFRPALEQLSHARTKYGFIYVAQNKALDIAKTAKKFDMALKIAKDINQHMSRHDKWLRIIGDILMLQTKKEEAKLKYSQALKSIESLSERQKKHSKTTQRKKQLLELLKGLSQSSS
jgi:tetratricopeptide (TPR) repeat protein